MTQPRRCSCGCSVLGCANERSDIPCRGYVQWKKAHGDVSAWYWGNCKCAGTGDEQLCDGCQVAKYGQTDVE